MVTGGTGSDVFVFNPGSGNDTIKGFAAGLNTDDYLQINGFDLSFEDVVAIAVQLGQDVALNLGPGTTVTLTGALPSDLAEEDFIFG